MKRIVVILLLAGLLLSGCAGKESGEAVALPKMIYADSTAVTAPPTPAPVERGTMDMGDLPSKLTELYIMDEGYKANAVASVGNTILAADTDHFDYQLVLASFEVSEAGEVELTSRNIILESQADTEEYETMIYNVSASPDGYYYVLTGEAPRASLQIYTEKDSHEIKENPDYSGKYRKIRYSAEGELLDSLDIPSLPTDGPGVFMADKDGRLVIFGFTFEPYDDGDPYDTHTISSTSMSVVDFYTGEYETFRYGMNIVFSACPNGEKALVFADMMDEGTAGLYNVGVLYTSYIYDYDAQGLLARRTTVFSGAVSGVESGAGVIEEYRYDELGRVIEIKSYYPNDEVGPSAGCCSFWYDDDGYRHDGEG